MNNDTIKTKFVEYLVDNLIKNENGLKTLETLIEEYPIEWEEFKETNG